MIRWQCVWEANTSPCLVILQTTMPSPLPLATFCLTGPTITKVWKRAPLALGVWTFEMRFGNVVVLLKPECGNSITLCSDNLSEKPYFNHNDFTVHWDVPERKTLLEGWVKIYDVKMFNTKMAGGPPRLCRNQKSLLDSYKLASRLLLAG